MGWKCVFLFVIFATLLAISMEEPMEFSPLPPPSDFDVPQQNRRNVTETDYIEMKNFRPHHSGMLPNATIGNHTEISSTPIQERHPTIINSTTIGNRSSATIRGNYPTSYATTQSSDRWWHHTTTRRPKRPRIFFIRDFPGRTGVPSWREVPPGTSLLDIKMKQLKEQEKKKKPTAAGVHNGSQNMTFNFQIDLKSFCLAFFLLCLCWP